MKLEYTHKARSIALKQATEQSDSNVLFDTMSLPEGGYSVTDNRHRTDDDWCHYYSWDPMNPCIGSTLYYSIHPESGEIRSAVIGE